MENIKPNYLYRFDDWGSNWADVYADLEKDTYGHFVEGKYKLCGWSSWSDLISKPGVETRPIEEEEQYLGFKVGDKVWRQSSSETFFGEGTVVGFKGVYVRAVFPGNSSVAWGKDHAWWCLPEELCLLSDRIKFVFGDDYVPGSEKITLGDASEPDTIESDGGPSQYYDFKPDWITWNDLADYKAKKQWKEYSFHLGNIGKAIYRWGEKSGTTIEYDAKKIIYSGLRVLVMLIGKQKTSDYLKTLIEDPQFKEKEN